MNSSNRLKSGGEDSPFFHTPKLPESLIGASEVYANTITTSPIILQQTSSKVDMAVLKRLRSFDSEDLGFSKRRFSESRPSLEGSFRTTKIPPSKSEQNEASTTQDFVSAKKKGFNDKSDKVIQDHVFTPPQIRASLHERDSKSHKSSPSKNESETKHSDSSEFVYENGSSCHQCKRRTPFRALTFCKNMFNYKGRLNPNKGLCRKKYCDLCMNKYYKDFIPTSRHDENSWECAACLKICTCAACRKIYRSFQDEESNKSSESDVLIDPQQMSPATAIACGLVYSTILQPQAGVNYGNPISPFSQIHPIPSHPIPATAIHYSPLGSPRIPQVPNIHYVPVQVPPVHPIPQANILALPQVPPVLLFQDPVTGERRIISHQPFSPFQQR